MVCYGLNYMSPQKFMFKSLVSQNVTLFVNRLIADVIC